MDSNLLVKRKLSNYSYIFGTLNVSRGKYTTDLSQITIFSKIKEYQQIIDRQKLKLSIPIGQCEIFTGSFGSYFKNLLEKK